MKKNLPVGSVMLLIGASALFASFGQAQPTIDAIAQDQDPQATRALVREIQFMLLRVGLDPGPLDGMPSTRTNRAVRRFQEMHGLPATELRRGGKVPTQLIAQLREEAQPAIFGGADKLATARRSPSAAVVQPSPSDETLQPKSATDANASSPQPSAGNALAPCSYDLHDFQIGPNRYTPDTFLKEGFDGLTAQAVLELKTRLDEGRQIAERIGAPALHEVQRQARVLQYFECRLKIEQAAASRN